MCTRNGIPLDPKKTIDSYNINPNNCEVYSAIPAYFFGSHGIVKEMKAAGFWEHNEKMLGDLDMEELYQAELGNLGNNKRKAMTAAMVSYLEVNYVDEYDELKLIIQKAKKYISK